MADRFIVSASPFPPPPLRPFRASPCWARRHPLSSLPVCPSACPFPFPPPSPAEHCHARPGGVHGGHHMGAGARGGRGRQRRRHVRCAATDGWRRRPFGVQPRRAVLHARRPVTKVCRRAAGPYQLCGRAGRHVGRVCDRAAGRPGMGCEAGVGAAIVSLWG
eukprot:357818-Chlamydomonas_euryale.AAC.1